MDERETNLEQTAVVLLRDSGISVLDAARLVLELQEMMPLWASAQHTPISLCRHVIRLGAEAYTQEFHTIPFMEAVERSLQSRAQRRSRTLAEIRQCIRRILRSKPELAEMPVRRISPDYCREIVASIFHTPTSQRKARRLLHGIFAFSMRHGWCSSNPMRAVDVPIVCENKVEVLTLAQVRRLLATTCTPEHLPCAAAVGFMLWAGIRPTELTRLRWEDVRIEDRVINIEARHSKTGGARHVTLYPVLFRWLKAHAPYRLPHAYIVPSSWVRRWRELRLAAGFINWHPDALRHTFASYHLKHFGCLSTLQIDMGHGDSQLLRTRYLGMKGISRASAAEFWGQEEAAARAARAAKRKQG